MKLHTVIACCAVLSVFFCMSEAVDHWPGHLVKQTADVADFYFGHRGDYKNAPHSGHKSRTQNVAHLKQYAIVEAQDGHVGRNQGQQHNFGGSQGKGDTNRGSQGQSEVIKSNQEQGEGVKSNQGEAGKNEEQISYSDSFEGSQGQNAESGYQSKASQGEKTDAEVRKSDTRFKVNQEQKYKSDVNFKGSETGMEDNKGTQGQKYESDKDSVSSDDFKDFYSKHYESPVSKSLFFLNPASQSGEVSDTREDTSQGREEVKSVKNDDRQKFFKNAFSLHLVLPIKH